MWSPAGVSHFVQDERTGIHYELQWDWSFKRAKKSVHGTFGCAKVINRSTGDGAFSIAEVVHAHICANRPCSAQPLGAEAIVRFGAVIHFQPSDWRPVPPEPSPTLPPPPLPPPPAAATPMPAAAPTPVYGGLPPSPPPSPPLEPSSPASSSCDTLGSDPPSPVTAEVEPVPPPDPLASVEHFPQPPAPPVVPTEPPTRGLLRNPGVAPPLNLEAPVTAVAEEPHSGAPSVHMSEVRILNSVTALAAQIRSPHTRVGYSGFVCFAICRKCRPYIWEGPHKIDVVSRFAQAVLELCVHECAVDAVRCCITHSSNGHVDIMPVSEHHPVKECWHYVAAVCNPVEGSQTADAHANVQDYYEAKQLQVVPTICDGDGALDVMSKMLGITHTHENRCLLRDEIADWILQVGQKEWFWDVLVATGDIAQADVQTMRESQAAAATPVEGPLMIDVNESAADALALDTAVADRASTITAAHLQALSWATGLPETESLVDLANSLPEVVLNQQLALHQAEQAVVPAPPAAPGPILVHKHLVKSRMQVAKAFDEFLVCMGWTPGTRIPRNAGVTFRAQYLRGQIPNLRNLRIWHHKWRSTDGKPLKSHGRPLKLDAVGKTKWPRRMKARGQQGRPHKCPWVREGLFEWYSSIRYSIDWSQVRARLHTPGLSSSGVGKSLARFTRQLVRQKAQQLLNDYCATCLLNGVRVSAPNLSSNWFRSWEEEYGLSMRKANRKYKVPKWVMGERLEIAWKNLARIRALCLACHGYDPQMENWDQSPFHNNETGSAEVKTLAVSGSVVPLVEGHADTRKRWTGNLTTFSDKARIKRDGPPYCEFVFKGGQKLELRLRQYIRERGFGPWLSVATTDSGSYKMPDVIKFLKTHLPDDFSPQSRQWRIIIADAFSAHLSPQVFNLCWNRGYVLITLGGGITPVVQTCDTDLNQHVKRQYMALETAELLQQMRDGINVPSNPPERCIDLMAEVLTKTSLHLDAAEGYVKVGFTVPLDGSGDQYIVREAGNFWRERGMRAKINETIQQVRDDYTAGRLRWSYTCVKNLIAECPQHRQYDDILRRIEDADAGISHDELPYLEDNAAEDESDADDDHCGWDGEDDATAVAGQGDAVPAVAGESSAYENADAGDMDDAADPDHHDERWCDLGVISQSPDTRIILSEGIAELVAHCTNKIDVYEDAMKSFQESGAIKLAGHCHNAIDAERRRLRHLTKENPDVARQLIRKQDAEAARQLKRRRELDELNQQQQTKKRLLAETREEEKKVSAARKQLRVLEDNAVMKTELSTYTPEMLGYEVPNPTLKVYREKRHIVLDKLSRLGQGLSPAQKADFAWWKEAWDGQMLGTHGQQWGQIFAMHAQHILDEISAGKTNAFSVMMHTETIRLLHGPALRL
jgi:hypothetical protein